MSKFAKIVLSIVVLRVCLMAGFYLFQGGPLNQMLSFEINKFELLDMLLISTLLLFFYFIRLSVWLEFFLLFFAGFMVHPSSRVLGYLFSAHFEWGEYPNLYGPVNPMSGFVTNGAFYSAQLIIILLVLLFLFDRRVDNKMDF